jgi:hypothetical protein
MRKLPDRCESSSTGEPTRSSPAMALRRAIVTSSREGSGICGAKSPSCTLLDCPASAVRVSESTAAGGGCAAISSCSSLSRNLRSTEGNAGRITRLCSRPPSSFISTSARPATVRALARANQAINHARAHEEQRVHLLDGRLELAEFFQRELWLDGLKGMGAAPRARLRQLVLAGQAV